MLWAHTLPTALMTNQNNVFSYKVIGGIALTVIMPIIFIWVACSVVIFLVIWQCLFWLGNFILENTLDKEPYCYGLFKDIHNINVRSQCSTMLSKTRLYYVFTEASRNIVRSKLAGSELWCSGCCMCSDTLSGGAHVGDVSLSLAPGVFLSCLIKGGRMF